MNTRLTLACALAALVFAVYGGSLRNGFVHDDHLLVERNVVVRTLDPVEHLSASFWSRWTNETEYYRPIATWSLALDRSIHGLSPRGFHLTNLLLHAGNAILLFLLARRFSSGTVAPFVAAAIFAIHPIQSESVVWVSGRTDLLAAGFVLAATLAAIRASEGAASKNVPWLVLLAVLTACALLSKEAAVTVPFFLLGVTLARGSLRRLLLPGAVAVGVVALYLAARRLVLGAVLGGGEAASGNWADILSGLGWFERLPTAVHVAGRYLGLVAYPASLSVDYGPEAVPLVTGFGSVSFALPALACVGGLAAAVFLARRSPLASFGLAASAGSYLLVSHLVFKAPLLMAERLLYLPMIGISALLAVAIAETAARLVPARRERAAAVLAALLLLPAAYRASTRTSDWKDDETLFASATRAQPRSLLAWTNLGAEHARRGDLPRASEAFDRALAIRPTHAPALWRKADLLRRENDLAGAEELLRAAASAQPRLLLVWINLAQVLNARAAEATRSGRTEAALAMSREVVEIAAAHEGDAAARREGGRVILLRERAEALARLGRGDEAERTLGEALEAVEEASREGEATDESLDALRAALLASSGARLSDDGKHAEAAARYEAGAAAADRAGQSDLERRLLLAAADEYASARKTGDAIRLFDRVIAGDPGSGGALRGRAHARLLAGDLDGAEADLRALLAGNPNGRLLADVWTEMARVALLRGDRTEGLRRLDFALRADPGFEDARRLRERAARG